MFSSYGLSASFQMGAEDLPVFLLQLSKIPNWSLMPSQAGTARSQALQGRGNQPYILPTDTEECLEMYVSVFPGSKHIPQSKKEPHLSY